ncbi:N-carbamoylputrescine amidase [Flavimaricola marinus]|uniref:N-carbamoyl-D-amino acid hydrolase n=1 Tax=Flavimaricola marinus TaxID=1819565 RepID=A0A238LEZ3_9RHOB|nr:N-carbamoylputrescine amidase [Flavimaricola marinus]SMY07526.1 N-carbamoyl-D-amino acid hydrolase [Flavimaricola marinus]
MSTLTLAVTQLACTWDSAANIDTATRLVREAAGQGAQLVLLQELFETPYFCSEIDPDHLALAKPVEGNPLIAHFAALAAELGVVIPVSFFERTERQFFNSMAMIDATGEVLGVYRKTHIPDGAGYLEKFYFTPGNTGFKVWDTAAGRIGVGICWDQWFPEAARSMALMGADVLLYPTAIGSEPNDPDVHSLAHWRRVMQGHAAANMCVVAASNRIGTEAVGPKMDFYGGSFITDETGGLLADMDAEPGIAVATVDLGAIARNREAWGLFRDRRPETYGAISTV